MRDVGLAGWGLRVGALAFAPLTLVQAFAAGALALTVPLAARRLGERTTSRDRALVGGLVAALVVVALGVPATDPRTLPAAGLAVALVVVAVAAGAAARLRRGDGAVLAAAGGALYGAGDAAIKAVTVELHDRGIAGLVSPWTLAVALLSAAAFALFQRGLQLGPAVAAVASMTGATAVVAIAIGLVVLGDPLPAGGGGAVHVAALAVVVACGARLAGAQERLAPP